MKKVVRVIGRMSGGGPPHQAAFLHTALRSKFDTVLIIGTHEENERDMRYLLQDSTNVIEIPSMSRSLDAWSDLVSLYAITRTLRQQRPDVVHTHTPKAGLLGRLAAFLAGVPVRIHTYHGHGFSGYMGRAGSNAVVMVERMLNKLSTHVIAISATQAEEITETFRVAPARKVSVIRNGIDLSHFADAERERHEAREQLGVKNDEILVVWAGRFTPIKDVPLLLRVVESAKRLSKVRFLVLGEGPMREAVMEAAKRSPNLQYGGWQEDMKPIWAASDVCLLTSKNEGTPMSMIESMAVGRPFVATEVGGIPDLAVQPLQANPAGCQQAQNGFLTSRDPDAIVACLETLSSSTELRQKMGEEARRFAIASFSQDRLAREITELYERLLERE